MTRVASLIVALALVPGCSLYFNGEEPAAGGASTDAGSATEPMPTGSFTLRKTRAIAGELPVVGIDSDHAGGLWIAYRVQTGDYYALADVRVVHLDASGTKVAEFRYNDEYTKVSGLAFSGDAIWLNYASTGTGNNHIRKLDPATGERIGSFATEIGIVDLDIHGDELRLSNLWNQVISIDRTTGGELWRTPITAFEASTQRGIASTAQDTLWVASWMTNRITLLDASHHVIGSGTTSLLDGQGNGFDSLHLAWDGSELLIVINNQIAWLAPQN